jgi:hypothetical protein
MIRALGEQGLEVEGVERWADGTAKRGLACEDYGSRLEHGRVAAQVSREKVRLCNRSGVTGRGEVM